MLRFAIALVAAMMTHHEVTGQNIQRSTISAAGSSIVGQPTVQMCVGQSSPTGARQGFIQPLPADTTLLAAAKSIEAFPNPASHKTKITGLEDGDVVELRNATGVVVKTVTVENKDQFTIDVLELPAGVYYIIPQSTKTYKTLKLIVNH